MRGYVVEDAYHHLLDGPYVGVLASDGAAVRLTTIVIDGVSQDGGDIDFIGGWAEYHTRVKIERGYTTGPSAGVSATPNTLDPFDSASNATWITEASVAPSGGTVTKLFSSGFNNRIGLQQRRPLDKALMTEESTWIVMTCNLLAPDLLWVLGITYVEGS